MPSEAGTPSSTPGPSMQQPQLSQQHPNSQGAAPQPQQFCLRWNNYQTNLTNVFDQLLQSESFVDVTLACDGHSVKAHKMVLSACSPYFQALFFENPCQHPIVIMRDIKWPELKAVVEFMYKGEINVSQEQIGPLLRVAETLKIRGLADVNGEPDVTGPPPPVIPEVSSKKSSLRDWDSPEDMPSPTIPRVRKRRRLSGERSSASSPADSLLGPDILEGASPAPSSIPALPVPPPASLPSLPPPDLPLALPLPPPMSHSTPHPDDMEIKPGIAEMIREEERAKLLENSHAWLGASTSSIAADSYQYQLQSMWQKCWNTNQSLVHNLRFRERGPLKSWRPETMAEAIFSVLKEGLSLSQAARKYDIPYPTFVLYANRVHNMLGPSADGGADLRPKGRGRPQRILLGVWPDEHIRGVIRTVVFRDHQHIKEEAHLQYARLPDGLSVQNYATGSCSNGPGPEPTVSPGAAAAAAVAAVAQGLRQQMCSMVAAAQHHPDHGQVAGLVGGLSLGHCASMGLGHGGLPHRLGSPVGSAHDLRMTSPEESPLASPLELALEPAVNLAVGGTVEVGIGVSGMAYKQTRGFTSPRPEHLFQEDIADLVSPSRASTPTRLAMGLKDRSPPIKMESLAECRGD